MPHVMKIRELLCVQCGKTFIGKDWGGGIHHKICSQECMQARRARIVRRRGPGNNKWIGGMTTWICALCGIQFQRYRLRGGRNRKYCSWDCANEAHRHLNRRTTLGPEEADDMRSRFRFENDLCEFLNQRGYDCLRSAGSRGAFDVFAFNQQFCRCIQVKSTIAMKRPGNTTVFREAIQRMQGIPEPPNLTKELWVWVLRKGWVYAIVGDAPRSRDALIRYVRNIQWIEPA